MNMKVIVGLLVGLLIIQVVGAGVYFLILSNNQTQLSQEVTNNVLTDRTVDPTTVGNGAITLQTQKSSIVVGEEIPVTILINTDNRAVEGVDLSLKYDPAFLQPVLVNNLPFVPGRLFPDVPLNSFDNRSGVASMSAISSLNQNYIGEGTFSLITFKAKKAGTTQVLIQAEKDNTTDSNMVVDGKEMLQKIEGLTVTIAP